MKNNKVPSNRSEINNNSVSKYELGYLSFKETFIILWWMIKVLYKMVGRGLATLVVASFLISYPLQLARWAIEAQIINIGVYIVAHHMLPNDLIWIILMYFIVATIEHLSANRFLGRYLIQHELSNDLNRKWKFLVNKAIDDLTIEKIQGKEEQSLIRDVIDRARVSSFIDTLSQVLTMPMLIVKVFLAFWISFKFSLIVGLMFLASVIANVFVSNKNQRIYMGMYKADREKSKYINYLYQKLLFLDTLLRFKEVNLLTYLNNLRNYIHKYSIKVKKYILRRTLIMVQLTNSFDLLAEVVILIIGFKQLLTNVITLGKLQFYRRVILDAYSGAYQLISSYERIRENLIYFRQAHRLFELAKKHQKNYTSILNIQNINSGIVIHNLWYKYPNNKHFTLKNINLRIKPGMNVAIVGENGAGKTTFIKVLLGHLIPSRGSISVFKTNPAQLRKTEKLKVFGVLNQQFETLPFMRVQDVVRLDSLAIKNIYPLKGFKRLWQSFAKRLLKLNNFDVLEEVLHNKKDRFVNNRVKTVIKNIGLDKTVEKMHLKYNTILSPGFKDGQDLSTGQWQRLHIARLLYTKRPITILDEPTSAIDPVAGFSLMDKIFETFTSNILLVISHKYALIKNADLILVFKDGKIIEKGTHAELIKQNGYYAKAYNQEVGRLTGEI